MVTFKNNSAVSGGGAYYDQNSKTVFMGNSLVLLLGNIAKESGRAIFSATSCIKLGHNSSIMFNYKTTERYSGGVVLINKSNLTIKGSYVVAIERNQERYGGSEV